MLIIVDDLKAALGSFGDADAVSPNMDRLSTFGLRFLNHHVQVSECAPSRLSFLTGKRPDQLQVYARQPQFRLKNRLLMTMPAHFRRLGYKTISVGKVFDQASFSSNQVYDSGNTDLCNVNEDANATTCSWDEEVPTLQAAVDGVRCPLGARQYPLVTNDPVFLMYGDQLGSGQYNDNFLDACLSLQGIARIDEFASTPEKPFFFALGFMRPHLPWSAPRDYWNMFPASQEATFAQKIWAKDISGATFFRRQSSSSSYRSSWDEINYYRVQAPKTRRPRAYYSMVAFVDAMVGRVVNHIQTHPVRQIRENTLIVLWGDNGLHLGPLLYGKKTLFEGATRTPLIVVPSVAWYRDQETRGIQVTGVGGAVSFPVEAIDIYPTIVDLANIDNLNVVFTGKSLVRYFFDQSTPMKKVAVSQYRDQRDKFTSTVMGYAIRSKNYRFIRYFNWDSRCFGDARACNFFNTSPRRVRNELYYYPYPGAKEVTNVYRDPAHAAARTIMEAILRNKDVPFSNN
jgi:iduronate 2-sulfatase